MKKHKAQCSLYNRGSAIIEITMMIPIFLGCIYLYIMLFLFFIETSKQMNELARNLYDTESQVEEKKDKGIQKKGKMETVEVHEKGKLFEIQLELNKDGSDQIENIRRWQLATGGI